MCIMWSSHLFHSCIKHYMDFMMQKSSSLFFIFHHVNFYWIDLHEESPSLKIQMQNATIYTFLFLTISLPEAYTLRRRKDRRTFLGRNCQAELQVILSALTVRFRAGIEEEGIVWKQIPYSLKNGEEYVSSLQRIMYKMVWKASTHKELIHPNRSKLHDRIRKYFSPEAIHRSNMHCIKKMKEANCHI